MVSEFNQWREILPSNMAAGLFIERLLGNKQSRMVERIGSIVTNVQLYNSPVSQYERPRAVALASSACVDKTIITEFTRKDLFLRLKRVN